jgi:hypothetical protein
MIQRKERIKTIHRKEVKFKKNLEKKAPRRMPKERRVIFKQAKSITVYFLAAFNTCCMNVLIVTPPCK